MAPLDVFGCDTCCTPKSCSLSYTIITFHHYEGVFWSQYCAPPKARPACRSARVAFSPAFPGDSDHQDGGACPAAPLDTGLTVVAAEGRSGSVAQPQESCMPGEWHCCWAACHAAGRSALERGCPRATRPSCLRRRRLHRRLRARGHSGRPRRVSIVARRGVLEVQRT